MIKDYISKMDPEKLIVILEEKGDFSCIRDSDGFRTYSYNLWDEVKNVTVPTVNPQLNAYHLAYAAEALCSERGTPRDFTILRCLSEDNILSCIDGIRERVNKIKEESDAGTLQDSTVQGLFVLCGELQEIQYICLERGFEKTAENAGNRLKVAGHTADIIIENHRG